MYISKIKLHNFRRFRDLEISFNWGRNVLVGDNESGKSSVLQAIDLAARGSRHRIEDIGLETLLNVSAVREFMEGEKTIERLPKLSVELYLGDTAEEALDGYNNTDGINAYGVRMAIEPDLTLSRDILTILRAENSSFPFEFYSISFQTFSGEGFNGYTKHVRTLFIDNSTIGNEFALNDYIATIYDATLSSVEQLATKHSYGNSKTSFKEDVLSPFNEKLPAGHSFAVKNTGKNRLENDLTIEIGGVPISEKGTGLQCLVKTQLALKRAPDIPVILLEEPENHLSHLNMRRLIDDIENNHDSQLFISTHSDLISTRLNLKNCILMNSQAPNQTVSLEAVGEDTAKFFMKAPDNNMLQFVLAKKVILVEGDAEFILMDTFCRRELNHSLSEQGLDVISVDGKCAKRYLEIAQILKNKVAVLTDNDGNYDENITAAYEGYMNGEYEGIKVFAPVENELRTFEVALYHDNKNACDTLFGAGRRTLTVQEYMLANKAEAAYQLVVQKGETITVPQYIKDALQWVNA